jgi:mRNA (2'-O-methyladenosine-N6-)-methyltransferase
LELALRLHNEEKMNARPRRTTIEVTVQKEKEEVTPAEDTTGEQVTALESYLATCTSEKSITKSTRRGKGRYVGNTYEVFSSKSTLRKVAKHCVSERFNSSTSCGETTSLINIKDLSELSSSVGTAELARKTQSIRKELREQIKRLNGGFYINCDIRYFNLFYLRECVGNFDVVLIDPPWRIAGGQRTSMPNGPMFTNNQWAVNYQTLSNEEILDIDIGCLSSSGLCFLWVVSSQLPTGIECLNRWGYEYIDKITWIKKRRGKLHVSHGYHFMHSSEICLVGIKRPCEFIGKVSNDVIFADVREKSRKPDELYHIIEAMLPGTTKIELFARNHNLRKGWLSLGNELGEHFRDWFNEFECDMCGTTILIGEKRYKSRWHPNSDLCVNCYQQVVAASVATANEWFELANDSAEPVYHEYYECNQCRAYPLWGVRFHKEPDMDLCEQCYDELIASRGDSNVPEKISKNESASEWTAIESPLCGGSLPVHRNIRCQSCLQCPIIGYRFACTKCENVSFCQKCFFSEKRPRGHAAEHDVVIVVDSEATLNGLIRCDGCGARPILGKRFRCNTCYAFDLCEVCHDRVLHDDFEPAKGSQRKFQDHNRSHTFSIIQVSD